MLRKRTWQLKAGENSAEAHTHGARAKRDATAREARENPRAAAAKAAAAAAAQYLHVPKAEAGASPLKCICNPGFDPGNLCCCKACPQLGAPVAGASGAAGPAAGAAAPSVKQEEKAEPALGAAGPVPPRGAQPAGVKTEPGSAGLGLGFLPSQPAGAVSGDPGVSPDPNPSSERAPGSASQEADVGDAEEEGGTWTGWSGWTGEDGE